MNIGSAQGWAKRCRGAQWGQGLYDLAGSMTQTHRTGRLLLVGPADDPPWHLAAHLDQMNRYLGRGLPTGLLNLATGDEVATGDSVLALTERPLDEQLLDRLDRLRGHVPVYGMSSGESELANLADHSVTLPTDLVMPDGLLRADFEIASHILGARLTAPRHRSFLLGRAARPRATRSRVGVTG